jgi:hypothetical protein
MMATVTNVRMVNAPVEWYPGLALAFDWQGRTRMMQNEQKYAVLNAGWVSILDDDVPNVQVSTRHRDGTPCRFSGRLTKDKDVLRTVRHYIWWEDIGMPLKIGPVEIPEWTPEPLPDAFGPPTEYRPAKP